jgi:hypothetical protein
MARNIYFRIAFIMLIGWWVYLFFTSEFIVVYDSSGYEGLGKMIAHQGWAEFLRDGPQREPMFPWLIALSMRMGDWWGISYYYPFKLIGLIFLSLTMIFSYRLMRMLSISRWLACLFVFYLGISPTMSTSCMRLWSEFAAYPWVVLAVIWTIKSWEILEKPSNGRREDLKVMGHAAMVALMFLGVMSVKAIAEGVLLLYLWPFYWRAFTFWRSKNFIKARQAAVFCLAVLTIFEVPVCAWRASNYHYNGEFAFTNRGDWALYGNTARRMQPLTLKRLGAAVAYVPPMGLCPSLFGDEDCNFWTARYSDDLIAQKRDELSARGINGDAASKYFIDSSFKMILSNPAQAVLLMFIEAHEMFFWEPITSFEVYPPWLSHIFYSPLFVNTMMTIVAFLSWTSCVFAFFCLCRRLGKSGLPDNGHEAALLWVFNFIFWYMGLYSLYFILDRYSYPLISLYVALIAFLTHRIIKVFVK